MKISERVELYYLQKYPKKKRVKQIEPSNLCKACKGQCKTSANLISCPGKAKFDKESNKCK